MVRAQSYISKSSQGTEGSQPDHYEPLHHFAVAGLSPALVTSGYLPNTKWDRIHWDIPLITMRLLIWVSAPLYVSSQHAYLSILGSCGAQWPCGIGKLFRYHELPEAANHLYDGSDPLYTLYNEKTDDLDKGLIESWLEHSRDLMVLVR